MSSEEARNVMTKNGDDNNNDSLWDVPFPCPFQVFLSVATILLQLSKYKFKKSLAIISVIFTFLSSNTYFRKHVQKFPELRNFKWRSCTPDLKREPNFSFAGLKTQRDEFDERILLGVNMGCGGDGSCGRSGCCVLGLGFQLHTHVDHMYINSEFHRTILDFRRAFRNASTPLIRRVSCGHVTGGWGGVGYEVVCLNDGHSGSFSLSNNEEKKIGLKLIWWRWCHIWGGALYTKILKICISDLYNIYYSI
jgi:hypothetical protein